MRPMRTFAAVLFTALSFTVFLESQTAQRQDPTHPKKVLTPEQQEYQRRRNEYMQKRQSLQREAKRVFETEMAREKAGDCPEARTTYDFNVCFGKQVTITDQNLKSYEDVIRQLVAGPPQAPGNQTPTAGIAGALLTPQQLSDEFDQLEQTWEHYRETACTAAFHQFGGGTGGPSFELQCKLRLARNHMQELSVIYGGDLRL